MTTIAYRSGILAFDTLVTSGTHRIGQITKAKDLGDRLVAAAGNVEDVAAFLDWHEKRHGSLDNRSTFFPNMKAESLSGLLVFQDRIFMYDEGLYPYQIDAKFVAIGSGGDIALGAMMMGASAIKAVEIASLIDTTTGGQINSLTLVKPKVKKKR